MAQKVRHKGDDRSLLGPTKRLLRRLDLRARKGLGQHFLVDEGLLKTIAEAAELSRSDVVVEVGPGLGVLTAELSRRAGWVVAVELDAALATALKQTLAAAGNVSVVNEDILGTDPAALLKQAPLSSGIPPGYKVVANLPYYITAAVLRHFLETSLKPGLMVVMVQKEVAEAIVAKAGRMSLLSISVHFYGKPEIVSYVPARCFYPAPEVDSAILRIAPYPRPAVAVTDVAGFFRLVRAGFAAPRKQLANSLAQGLGADKAGVLPLLEGAGIAPERRAETLALEEWVKLWREFSRAGGSLC
jgi:16S rRNA (adenine1518-N6/adenine1519-N6)-dimethyltransferase